MSRAYKRMRSMAEHTYPSDVTLGLTHQYQGPLIELGSELPFSDDFVMTRKTAADQLGTIKTTSTVPAGKQGIAWVPMVGVAGVALAGYWLLTRS